MQRAHLHTVSVAALMILAGCPPIGGEETGSETGTGTDSSPSTTGNEATDTQPTDTNPPGTSTDETNSTGSMSDSESNTGTSATTVDPTTGMVEPDCDANKPCEAGKFCEAEKCVTCDATPDGDAACAGADPNAPVCADGACVECTADNATLCTGSSPVCVDNACSACTQHSECPDSACNFETGACFGLEYVLYVDRAAPCDGATGTMEAPFCKIADAFPAMMLDDVALGWTIKIKAGNYIEEPLVVPDGAVVTFTRWGEGAVKVRAPDDAGDTLTIQNASTVYLDRLEFKSNADFNGVLCASAKVYADDVRFTANRKQGYESTDCETKINRSVIFDNDGGGLASYGAGTTTISNSYITGNGSQNFGDYGGIRTAQGNELHLLFSTVVNGLSQTGPRSLHCFESGPTEVRNSVLIAFAAPSVDCPGVVITTSAVDEGAVDGDGNVIAVTADIMNYFDPPTAGVYPAKPGTPLENLAVWKTGDPKTDFNGTARVNMDGGMDFAGADKP